MNKAPKRKDTHKVTMTISSFEDTGDINIKVKFDPDIEGIQITELGYLPAAYQLVQEYVLPAFEDAYMDNHGVE